jgi:uncharacterized repeat protein (TIGR01451 family)
LANGCQDTDNNFADFEALTPSAPRNSASSVSYCTAPQADLDIAKSGPATASASDPITYTINISNAGTTTATSTLVTDTLPTEVSFVTYTTALPVNFSQPDAQTLVWDLGDVANGASGQISVQGVISSGVSNGTAFTNTVTASTTATETNTANNTATATTLVGAPDLVVIKDGPASVNAGDQVAYTLTYSNAGDLTAIGVLLVDQLPTGMTYITDSLGSGVQFGNTITWPLVSLANGASGSIVLTATANYVGDQVNVATISGSPTDSNPLDNVSVFTTTVLGSDPFVSKTGPTAAFSGELITYTVVYGNHGSAATDVTLTDTLPISFTTADIAYDNSGLTPIDGTGTRSWTRTLAAGDRFTFTLALTVPTSIASNTRFTNTIQIAGSGLGNNPIDDLSSASGTVYQIVPVATMRAGSIGQVFAITGTVTVEPGVFTFNGQNRYMYIQDSTGGVLVYRDGGLDPVARGHIVRIVGSRDEYKAETEFVPANASDVLDLGAGIVVSPLVTNTGSIDESVEGELVQISGQITGKPAAYRLQVNDGSGMVEVNRYFNLGQTTDPNYIDFTPFGVGDYVRVVGVTRGYTESFGFTREVLPRGPIDIAEYPRVLSVSPAPAATGVAVAAPITAAFNLTMTNVSGSTFLVQGPGGAVAGTVAYDSATKTAVFTPTAALATNTLYTATLKATLLADNGLTLMPGQDYVWSFRTRLAAPDLSASTKANSVTGAAVHSGQWVTYTITLSNTGDGDATAVVTDVLGSYYSVAAALDFTQPTTGTLTWTGVVTAGQSVDLQFVAQVKGPQDLPLGPQLLMNSAQVSDGVHSPFNVDDPMPPTITIYGVYLPLIKR